MPRCEEVAFDDCYYYYCSALLHITAMHPIKVEEEFPTTTTTVLLIDPSAI
jgi:hypothetical protein